MILLDTNVWSVLPKPGSDRAIVDWIVERSDRIWLSVIAIAEIRMGIENPKAEAKRAILSQWLADLELVYTERTQSFGPAEAHVFGKLVARGRMEKQETKLLDIQLAAQALANDMTVATRNTDDFEWTGVKLLNPWTA